MIHEFEESAIRYDEIVSAVKGEDDQNYGQSYKIDVILRNGGIITNFYKKEEDRDNSYDFFVNEWYRYLDELD